MMVGLLWAVLICWVSLVGAFLVKEPSCHGDVLRVPTAAYPTIQSAVDKAGPGDMILVADGIHRGPGNRDIDLLGKAIRVRSAGGPKACIIDCEGEGRGFVFQSGEGRDSAISGFTITGGRAERGGGILCLGSSPTIENCVLVGNEAGGNGGGLYASRGSEPYITRCVMAGNRAGGDGGGLYAFLSAPGVERCLIGGNLAGERGGGVALSVASPLLSNCSVIANKAGGEGGGIWCEFSDPRCRDLRIRENLSGKEGGGF